MGSETDAGDRHSPLSDVGSEALGAWFLGPLGENGEAFRDLVVTTIKAHVEGRRAVYPGDPPWITPEVKGSPSYKDAFDLLEQELGKLSQRLVQSVPFFSYR